MDLPLLFVLLVLSASFSGSETAFFSLRRSELAALAGRGAAGRRVTALLARPSDLLSAILIGNLVVNVAASVVATTLALSVFGSNGLAVAVPAVTLALLLFGEITPKLLALRAKSRVALVAQAPLTLWILITRPLLWVISPLTHWLVRALPLERTGSRLLTVPELQTACDLAVEEGTLGETEGRFLARLLGLRTLAVREIMTPRPDVEMLDAGWGRGQVLSAARRAGFNRYPVAGSEGDMPVGFVHLKDLLGASDHAPVSELVRPLIFAPESKDAASLLTEMRTGGVHLAAVIDEHGDFTGIVTLADCLQALIGPVADVGSVGSDAVQIGPRRWVLAGWLDLRALREIAGIELPPSRNYVTLAGFVMARLGRIPAPGDRVLLGGWRFTVLEMEANRVGRVLAAVARNGREETS
ncbi:MAG: hemolysin family protein [Candidatus Krumholzibacteriia bacterium]